MLKTKEAYAAGKFYISSKNELLENIESFKNNHKEDYNYQSRAIIVPHAGYIYSGQLAFDCYSYLDKNVKNIFIFAPTHKKSANNLLLSEYDEFETPLGTLPVNWEIQEDIINKFKCEYYNDAFAEEHAIEVQLPFLQYFYNNDISIIPILVGNDDVDKTLAIMANYYDNPENAFVISSDLSHFLNEKEQQKMDTMTAAMVESGFVQGFRFEQACGAIPVCALSEYSRRREFSLIRVGLSNSAKTTGDTSRVVGYGAWFLYEGPKNEFIANNFAPKLMDVVKKTIDAKLMGKTEINLTNYYPYPPVLDSDGACFVTLELDGNLRGCIGSSIAHAPMIVDLIKNSYNAAFSDPRFTPLTRNEFENIDIAISLLSMPVKIIFDNEADLLEKLRQNIDGLIIRDGDKQALYLPSVWEQIPDKKLFLNSLKRKAGMAADHFSDTFEAYRFETNYIK